MHSGTYGTELGYIRQSMREKEETDGTCKRSFYLSTSAP